MKGSLLSNPKVILSNSTSPPARALWLIRIPDVFLDCEVEILRALQAVLVKKLGRDYRLVRCADPGAIHGHDVSKFVSWSLPVHHSWPCNPQETQGFIEKAAQALVKKFGDARPQALMTGALDSGPSNRYYRTLASNLRGRALQIFPPAVGEIREAEEQSPLSPTLFCLIGKEGLFCGLQSPQSCGGFHPGGTRFIRQNTPDTISRAGAKIVGALHQLRLYRPAPATGAHWLELGASPGGMTAELLNRGYQVTAVDRAPLDPRLKNSPGLHAVIGDASSFEPAKGEWYDVILSDMNGDALDSITRVIRLCSRLKSAGLVIFTLKTAGVVGYDALNALETSVIATAAAANLDRITGIHLAYNRHEFTLIFERRPNG
jgi:23S rRNA (cytidine2498-2'-O)-methyltransferase